MAKYDNDQCLDMGRMGNSKFQNLKKMTSKKNVIRTFDFLNWKIVFFV